MGFTDLTMTNTNNEGAYKIRTKCSPNFIQSPLTKGDDSLTWFSKSFFSTYGHTLIYFYKTRTITTKPIVEESKASFVEKYSYTSHVSVDDRPCYATVVP